MLLGAPLTAVAQHVRVGGDLRHPLSLDTAALGQLGADTLTLDHHGEPVRFRGVSLWRLLQVGEVMIDPARRGDRLRKAIVATAADRYQVVLSLGELDPELGGRRVLVAWERDGGPLPADRGPFQLVVAGDARGARSLYQLERIDVVTLGLQP